VLAFTAEEIWQYIPDFGREAESIHLASWAKPNPEWRNGELEERWERLQDVRDEVYKVLEEKRQEKFLNDRLEAKVVLGVRDNALYEFLKEYEDELWAVFIVSNVELVKGEIEGSTSAEEIEGLYVKIEKAPGEKCARCWIYSETVGENQKYPDICSKCVRALEDGDE